MPPLLAAVVYGCGVLFLFWLDPDLRGRVNASFLVPLCWLLINGSRPVSEWIHKQAISPNQLTEGNPIDRWVFLAIQVAGFVILYQRRAVIERVLRANPFLLLFIFYAAMSITWSDFPSVAFKRWIKVLGDITMVLIVLTSPNQQRAIKRILITAAFILIPCSILLDKYFPGLSRYYDAYSGSQFFSGVGDDKNMLGMTCLVFGLAVVWQLLLAYKAKRTRKRTNQLVAYGLVFLMVIYLFRSANSMTSLSCFAIGTVILGATILLEKARKPAFLNVLVCSMVGAIFAVLFLHVSEKSLLGSMGRNATLTGRTEIWASVLHFSGNPIFGTGFESFWLGPRLLKVWSYNTFSNGINEAHNGYLEMYLNLGLIGVALLAGMIVTGYRKIMKALGPDPEVTALRLAFFVVAIVYGFTEVAFRENCSVWLAFLFAIMAVPLPSSRIVRRRTSKASLFPAAGSEDRLATAVEENEGVFAHK